MRVAIDEGRHDDAAAQIVFVALARRAGWRDAGDPPVLDRFRS
jgi:hypothetical protein